MVPRLLRWIYARWGPRYARRILIAQFQFAHLVTLAGLGLLVLYQRMSFAEFLALLAVAEVLVALENLASIRLVLRLLGPVEEWLRGDRDDATTVAAWRTLVELPS